MAEARVLYGSQGGSLLYGGGSFCMTEVLSVWRSLMAAGDSLLVELGTNIETNIFLLHFFKSAYKNSVNVALRIKTSSYENIVSHVY